MTVRDMFFRIRPADEAFHAATRRLLRAAAHPSRLRLGRVRPSACDASYPRWSLRYLMRWGRAASWPRRRRRFSSYWEKLPSNQ